MNKTNKNAIFYIDNDNGFYYGGDQMLTLAFPKDILSDQDILNKEKFYVLFKSFVETNKLEPANITIIVAPTLCYTKDYDGSTVLTEKDNQEIKNFIDLVPFEDVLDRQYKIGKRISVACVNRDLAMTVRSAFEKEKFTVNAVVPYTILQLTIPELAENVDFDLMLSRFDSLKQHNMVVLTQVSPGLKAPKDSKPKKNLRVLALSGVFGILALVLVFMIVNTYIMPAPQKVGEEPTTGIAEETPANSSQTTPIPQAAVTTVPLGNNVDPVQTSPVTSTSSGLQQL